MVQANLSTRIDLSKSGYWIGIDLILGSTGIYVLSGVEADSTYPARIRIMSSADWMNSASFEKTKKWVLYLPFETSKPWDFAAFQAI